MQYRALVIALILLLGTTVPEVHSRSVYERERRDWLAYPEKAVKYIYECVNKMSPTAGQFLLDFSQTTPVTETRNFLIRETTKITIMAEQLLEKFKNLCAKMLGY
ncbi:apovitellenin-1-like [Excalfactoria chinensis]|uniref:apovitellenin-1-like n=1 Tax=Excalfactoria chinensis TaxID=46218 RepID=UPI003B3B9DB2